MVHLEDFKGENKRAYETPVIFIKHISYADVIFTSGTMEGGNNDAGGNALTGGEGGGDDFSTP